MAEDLVRQWFLKEKTKYITSENQMACHGIHLFMNWMKQNHEKVFELFLEKTGRNAVITIKPMSEDLVRPETTENISPVTILRLTNTLGVG